MIQKQEKTEEMGIKAEVLEKLDRLGLEWYEAVSEGNNVEKKNLELEIFTLIINKAKLIKGGWRTESDNFFGAVNLFYCNDLPKYDPQYKGKKAPFSQFVRSRISLRTTDNYNIEHENKKMRKKQEDGTVVTEKRERVSIEGNADEEKEGRGRKENGEINEKNKMKDPALILDEDAGMCVLLSLFMSIPENLHGKQNNESKKAYYKLFGTENITGVIRESPGNILIKQHERDILSAIKCSFLNYYMLNECKTVQDIECCPMKLRKDVEKDSTDEREVKIPFANKLYLAYFDRIENKQIADSTISMQKKSYKDLLGELLNKR